MTETPAAADRSQFGSAAEYAYTRLRNEIIGGRFAPGRRMREIEIAAWLGVSRTPTRQALSRLEIEGLLDIRPRVGLVVSSLDAAAIDELYEMRAALEGTAAAMAARHASQRDIETLVQLVHTEALLPPEPSVRYEHNLTFHQAIYVAAHNRFLMKSLHALRDAVALLGPTTLSAEERYRDAQSEHDRIVQAISARDADRAEAEARAHVQRALAVRQAMRNPAALQSPQGE